MSRWRKSGLRKGSLLCVLPLLVWIGASCSPGGDGGTVGAITVPIESDGPPLPIQPSSPNPEPPQPSSSSTSVVAIAKCLRAKGAVLYGASWCRYTQQQISSFGEGFRHLRYVECTEQAEVCRQKDITGYPTWIIGKRRVLGFVPPAALGAEFGCSR